MQLNFFAVAETPPHPLPLPEGKPHPRPLPEGEGSSPSERGQGGEVGAGG